MVFSLQCSRGNDLHNSNRIHSRIVNAAQGGKVSLIPCSTKYSDERRDFRGISELTRKCGVWATVNRPWRHAAGAPKVRHIKTRGERTSSRCLAARSTPETLRS